MNSEDLKRYNALHRYLSWLCVKPEYGGPREKPEEIKARIEEVHDAIKEMEDND